MRIVPFAAIGLLSCGVAAPIAAHASPNLLINGSFEASSTAITGWTVSAPPYGSGPGNGPQLITTDGITPGPYGDRIAADPFTFSPDASGTHAVYFVDDSVTESLSQVVNLAAGTQYAVGFDAFQTLSGANNPGNFSLSASLGGLGTTQTSGTLSPGVWTHFAGTMTPTAGQAGTYLFTFNSGPGISKDVVIDDVYVTAVDEPSSYAMVLAGVGLLGIAGFARRRATLA